MSEIILNRAGVDAVVGKLVAASVSQHMRVRGPILRVWGAQFQPSSAPKSSCGFEPQGAPYGSADECLIGGHSYEPKG
jgi:hypothetical protein